METTPTPITLENANQLVSNTINNVEKGTPWATSNNADNVDNVVYLLLEHGYRWHATYLLDELHRIACDET